MDYKITKKEKNIVEINVTLNAAEWQEEVEQSYVRNRDKYKVEGFRKGKVPRKVIEKTYGESVFYEDALSEGFYKIYMQVLEKEPTIQPVDMPTLDVKTIDDNGVQLVATVVVQPQVKVNKYKGLDVELKTEKVTKKEVDKEIEAAKEQAVKLVEKDGAVVNGDVANINFSGSTDGVKFEGGTSENYDLEIGSKSFIAGFEEQLIGLKAGDEKDVKVDFPKDYHAEELAGKPAIFAVKVNAVKEKQYPELNDEFASSISEFKTMAEYEKSIKERLEEQFEQKSKVDAENKIIDLILQNTEVEVPEVMVERELDALMQDLEYRLMYQGLNLEAYAGYLNTTIDKLKEERKDDALKSVKIRLALTSILDKESIAVSDKEVEDKINEMAKSNNKSVKEYKESLAEDRINYIKNDILMSKLLSFLLDNNLKK